MSLPCVFEDRQRYKVIACNLNDINNAIICNDLIFNSKIISTRIHYLTRIYFASFLVQIIKPVIKQLHILKREHDYPAATLK